MNLGSIVIYLDTFVWGALMMSIKIKVLCRSSFGWLVACIFYMGRLCMTLASGLFMDHSKKRKTTLKFSYLNGLS